MLSAPSKVNEKKIYIRLTVGQKLELCRVARMRSVDKQGLAMWATRAFDLPCPPSDWTIKNILREGAKLRQLPQYNRRRKKAADPVIEALDRVLLAEFDKMAVEVQSLTDYGLIYRAKLFVDEYCRNWPAEKLPGFSKGWVYRFRKRHGIRCRRKQGEAGSVPVEAIEDGRAEMRKLTDRYAFKDIYNMDETGFFYRAETPCTLSKKKDVVGRKADKTRITMAVTTNADGSDKVPLLFIGKSKVPRVFKGRNITEELGVEYTNSRKAWMNGSIFLDWLHKLDQRMQQEDRHILLLVDNVSSHMKPDVPLTNVKLESPPKNTTSVLQPLDQGIIACIKSRFSRIKMETCIDRYVAGLPQEKIAIDTAMEWAATAWGGVTPEIIANSWVHSGIIPRPSYKMAVRHVLN